MKTITLLGVGSTYFTKGIVESILKQGGAWDIRMCDIDETRLDIAMKLGERLLDFYGKTHVKISGNTDRLRVLEGADVVVSTIGVGGRKAWEQDVLMFRPFNIYQSTGDTFGAGGLSRALRTIPVLLDIARDIEQLCPNALFVNFTNPMSVNCWALNKYTKIKTIGLCYGVTYFQHFLAELIGADFAETWSKAIGVNHFTWITEMTKNGRDAWPLVREAIAQKPDIRSGNPYTWDLFDAFGVFPTVGDGHISEFMPGLQHEGAYYGKTMGTSLDAGHDFVKYAAHWDDVFADMAKQAYGRKPIEPMADNQDVATFRDEDLFTEVLLAYMGEGPAVERTVNLRNNGIVANLPPDCIVEVTTLVNSTGFHPYACGALPAGLNAIMQRVVASHALTVEASVSGNRALVIQALMADCVALNLADAEGIANVIFEAYRGYF